MKTLRLFAAALTLFFSVLLQAQRQVDLTKEVNRVAPAANGGVPAGIAAGSRTVSSGVGQPGVYQTKLVVDMRDPSTAAGSAGVTCNGTTDDTAAIQAYFNYYGNGGAGGNAGSVQLNLPAGTCRISNELVFEGNTALGLRLVGVKGQNNGLPGTQLGWYGPNFGTMMLVLGSNGTQIENLDFIANESGNGGGKAQNGLWFDASNTVTQVAYNISAVSRSSNVVTVTTTAAHLVTAGRIVKVAGSTGGATSFNGTFQVQYANDNTHISWFQTGPNESGTASTGTVTNYKSSPSNNLKLLHAGVAGHESVSSTIRSITGTGPYTITTRTPHFAFPGDTVIARDGSDSTHNCAYVVGPVPSSTTLTVVTTQGTFCNPSRSNSTGGTLLGGSSGIRVAHADSATPEVASLYFTDLFVQGDGTGGSINCLESDGAGNVKDFIFENLQFNGCRYGVNGFNSGQLSVYGYTAGLTTPDAMPQLAAIDFVNNGGQIFIQGAEMEGSNRRFFVSTFVPGSMNVHLDGVSFQSVAPTDDYVIVNGGAMTITNSTFFNSRASGSVPFITLSPSFTSNGGSLISIGNTYTNTALGCAGPSCGWIPVTDYSGNIWHATGGNNVLFGENTNITSIGDHGTVTASTGNTIPLNTALPLSVNNTPLSGFWNCTNVTPVSVNASTTSDQNLMSCLIGYPKQWLSLNKTLRIRLKGIYSTTASSTATINLKAKFCHVSGCGSGIVIIPVSITSAALGSIQATNNPFLFDVNITMQTSGSSAAYEGSGQLAIDLAASPSAASSLFLDTNTATVGANDATTYFYLQLSGAFSAASASNSMTARQLIVETVN